MIFPAIYWGAWVVAGMYLMVSSAVGHHEHPAQRFFLGAAVTVLFSILFWKSSGISF